MTFIGSLQASSELFITICAILGITVGSFLNVVIYRLPKMMQLAWHQQCAELNGEPAKFLPVFNLVTPRSNCPQCGHKITMFENIPLISYLFLKGRCSKCHERISIRYPIVELLTGLMSGFAAWYYGYSFMCFAVLIFIWAMIALTFIDFDTQLLPDVITLPLLWIGFLINLNNGIIDLQSAVVGAMVGYLALWVVYWIFKLTTGKEGMGYGDFKLLAAIGAWLGWQSLPLVILSSSFVGGLAGIFLIYFRNQHSGLAIPFGPYLAGGGLIAMFWGKQINHIYLSLF